MPSETSGAPAIGANVMINFKGELLAKVHLLHLQVPWSTVRELYSEAVDNEKQGIMTVDIATMKRDGQLVFGEDFPIAFKDVFVKRFIPCLVEKFNQRNPDEPMVNLPGDVSDALRLLVVCERLDAVMKQDVKAHIMSLLDKSLVTEENRRANESSPFRVFQTSMDLDVIAPPRSSLQELVVNRSLEMLIAKLPDSLDALSELHMIASEMHRHHMCNRLFKATSKRSLDFAVIGSRPATTSAAGKREAEKNEADAQSNAEERERLRVEREALEKEKDKVKSELARLEMAKKQQQQQQQHGSAAGGSRDGSFAAHHQQGSSTFRSQGSEPSNGMDAGMCGVLALRQGILIEKIGRPTGNRIVRLMGDTLEWRKEYGRFTRDHSIMRCDVISVKTIDQSSFSISHKSGLLTLRALSEQSAVLFAQAVDCWVKGKSATTAAVRAMNNHASSASASVRLTNNMSSMSLAPAATHHAPMPSMALPHAHHHQQQLPQASTTSGGTLISRRFPRMSTTFTRPPSTGANQNSNNNENNSNLSAAAMPPMPKTSAPLDYSFGSTDST